MVDELKKRHDELLEAPKPDALSDEEYASLIEDHKSNCSFCNGESTDNDPDGRGDMEKTYSQDELDTAIEKAVNEAVAPLQTKIADFETSQAEGEIQAQLEAAKADAESKIAEAQEAVDKAELAKTAAEQKVADIEAYLEAVQAEAEEAAALETRKGEVLTKAKAAGFKDDYIAERIEGWAKKTDEEFASMLEDWAAITPPAPEGEGEQIEALDTAIDGTRKDKTGKSSGLSNLLRAGVDLTRI